MTCLDVFGDILEELYVDDVSWRFADVHIMHQTVEDL